MTWYGHRLIIFGFLPQISKTKAVAVGASVQQSSGLGEQARSAMLDDLVVFRGAFYDCLTLRADALFELTDAVLCADGPVSTLVGLTLTAEHRRGHGALYDGLGSGRIQVERLRRSLVNLPVPRDGQGRITLAVDVSPWLRPDAATSPDRSFCHVYGRGKGQAQMIPGWPYSFVAALEPGRTSWTALLDAVRLGPGDDATTVTATQLRELIQRLQHSGQHKPGDADILIVFDAGYDVTRLAFLLADLPVELLGRLRSDRVFCAPPPPRVSGAAGRPSKHGPEFALAQAATQPEPDAITDLPLVYIGNQYDRDEPFDRYFAPVAATVAHLIAGKWTDTRRWPHLHFIGRVPFTKVEGLHRRALATMLLTPDRLAIRGQFTQRIFEAVLAGCVPITPAYLRAVERVVPPELIARDADQACDVLHWLTAITGGPGHAELIGRCLRHLAPFRLSRQLTVLARLLDRAISSREVTP